jgi:hypothetical protein
MLLKKHLQTDAITHLLSGQAASNASNYIIMLPPLACSPVNGQMGRDLIF